jgi:hypothetical protein
MELLRIPGEYTFRMQIEREGKTLYDVGMHIDAHAMDVAPDDVLESVLRTIGRRVSADWKERNAR